MLDCVGGCLLVWVVAKRGSSGVSRAHASGVGLPSISIQHRKVSGDATNIFVNTSLRDNVDDKSI